LKAKDKIIVGSIVKLTDVGAFSRKGDGKWFTYLYPDYMFVVVGLDLEDNNVEAYCIEKNDIYIIKNKYFKLATAKEEISKMENNNKFVVGDWIREYSGKIGKITEVSENVYYVNCGNPEHIDVFGKIKSVEFAFKNGEEVEVAVECIFGSFTWVKRVFIGINPTKEGNRYIYIEGNGVCSSSSDIRPLQPKPTTIPVNIGSTSLELSIESAKELVKGIKKELNKTQLHWELGDL